MKYALAIVAGLAVLAAVHAVPVAEDDVYIREHIQELVDVVKSKANVKIQELKKTRDQLIGELKTARDEAKVVIGEKLQQVSREIKSGYETLLQRIKAILANKEETYFRQAIVDKIRELRLKATATIKEVAEVIKRQAEVVGTEAIESFEQQKKRLFDHLETLKQQLTETIKRNLGGDSYSIEDDIYVIKSVLEALKGKMGEVKGKISDVTDQLKTAAGEKKQQLQETLKELRGELGGILSDVREAIREIFGKNSYSLDDEDLYIVETVRQLRAKLSEKLEQLKELTELAKIGAAVATDQARAGVQKLKEEAAKLKDDIIKEVRGIFKN